MSSLEHLCNAVSSFSKLENITSSIAWTRNEVALLVHASELNAYRLADGRINWTLMKKTLFPHRKPNALRNKYLRIIGHRQKS